MTAVLYAECFRIDLSDILYQFQEMLNQSLWTVLKWTVQSGRSQVNSLKWMAQGHFYVEKTSMDASDFLDDRPHKDRSI